MKTDSDPWYIRFPDGREVRLPTTEIVRRNLELGRVPLASLVRRSLAEDWRLLEWTEEFAGLVTRLETAHLSPTPLPRSNGPAHRVTASIASRLDPDRLKTVGVPSWIQELLAALDSVLVRKKLLTALACSLFLGVVLALFRSGLLDLEMLGYGLGSTLAGAGLLLVFCISNGLLTRLTYTEVSRLRPARWRDGLRGLAGLTCQLVLVFLLIPGSVLVLLGGLLVLSAWLVGIADPAWSPVHQVGAQAAAVLAVLAGIALVPLSGLALLVSPILVVERCSVWKALTEWLALLRRELGRILAYEVLAVAIGLMVTLPFLVPLLVVPYLPLDASLLNVASITSHVLSGLGLAPLLAYLTVANLFIYLNLRYGPNGFRPSRAHSTAE
jgi:hypothetical protein